MSTPGVVTVEEVTGGKARVRFVELPQALHGHDPRWAPPVMAWERYRLDPHRNPYFERGDAVYLLARRLGRPAGRIVAHVAEEGGEGRFGFFTCIDDAAVASALVEAAQGWLDERGCTSMTGPWSFEPTDEPGILVEGFDVPGTTGRPWHPPWESALLAELGFSNVEDQPTWRLPTGAPAAGHAEPAAPAEPLHPEDRDAPGQAGPYLDRRLVLPGIAAVPDLSDALRHSSFRTAWRLAKRARAGDWETCTIVRSTADPSGAVPALRAAAAAAGYRWVVAPGRRIRAPTRRRSIASCAAAGDRTRCAGTARTPGRVPPCPGRQRDDVVATSRRSRSTSSPPRRAPSATTPTATASPSRPRCSSR